MPAGRTSGVCIGREVHKCFFGFFAFDFGKTCGGFCCLLFLCFICIFSSDFSGFLLDFKTNAHFRNFVDFVIFERPGQ